MGASPPGRKDVFFMLTIKSANFVYDFSPDMKCVAEAAIGETVVFETQDCFAGQIQSEETLCSDIDFGNINPATGPLKINGASKGDLLGVEIKKIEIAEQAVAVVVPGAGAMPEKVKHPLTRIIKIVGDNCSFDGVPLKVNPMIGVIGVATASEKIPTGTPGSHGGNMDTKDIREGAVVWFPVSQEGAMLAVGDCHSIMGDGEIGCSGAETAAKVTVSTEILRQASFPWPILVNAEEIMVIASGDSLDIAARAASEAMVWLVARALSMDMNNALILCSMSMDLRISQIVDPQKTVRAAISRDIMSWDKARKALIERGLISWSF